MSCKAAIESGALIPVGPIDSRYTVQSLCGAKQDKSLSVDPVRGLYWCYKCRTGGRFRTGGRTTTASLAPRTQTLAPRRDAVPRQDWPQAAVVTAARLGFTEEMLSRYSVTYDSKSCRLKLHAASYDKSWVTQWRATRKDQLPKYITERSPDNPVAITLTHRLKPQDTYVLVEDIASAIHIHYATAVYGGGYVPVCLLGTALRAGPGSIMYQAGLGKIITWLDQDRAGLEGTAKIKATLNMYGHTSRCIAAGEPKSLSSLEILGLLNNAT